MSITKNITAVAWFEFQKRADVTVMDVETIYIDGEKLMHVTFTVQS